MASCEIAKEVSTEYATNLGCMKVILDEVLHRYAGKCEGWSWADIWVDLHGANCPKDIKCSKWCKKYCPSYGWQ